MEIEKEVYCFEIFHDEFCTALETKNLEDCDCIPKIRRLSGGEADPPSAEVRRF